MDKLSKQEIQSRFNQLEEFAQKKFPETSCFRSSFLESIVHKIDEIWYDGYLGKHTDSLWGGLQFSHKVPKHINIAGFVKVSEMEIVFTINRDVFYHLFRKGEKGYHAGGLVCSSRLRCFLNVVAHETVHVYLAIKKRLGDIVDTDHHGEMFQTICRNIFGQLDYRHGLIPGLEHTENIEKLRKKLKIGKKVELYLDNEFHHGKITNIKDNDITVENSKWEYKIHPGLISKVF
jgi:hypothetical protein